MVRLRKFVSLPITIILLFLSPPDSSVSSSDSEKNCTECHPDYFKNLSAKNLHKPFKEKKCLECHIFHGFDNRQVLAGTVSQVCSYCHNLLDEIPPDALHYPLTEDYSCVECHNPHSSDNRDLLKLPGSMVCLECHDAPPTKGLTFVHPPYADITCTECHAPHGSTFGTMFQMPAGYLCASCHPQILNGEEPPRLHSADDIHSCDRCHLGHTSEYRKLLSNKTPELCLGCHDELNNLIKQSLPHSAIEIEGCVACHTPHFIKDRSSLILKTPGLCFECHSEIQGFTDMEYPHAAVEDGCETCHDPHIQLSDDEKAELCVNCHDIEDGDFQKRHLNLTPSFCFSCHDPHGSSEEKLLKINQHPPFMERECESCHKQQEKSELRNDSLCLDCHDQPEPSGGHKASSVADLACIDCHSPHASNRNSLLR
ncbi:MAG: cytochrome c3 family protein [candidate division Zixibacteria bacterium]